MEPGGNRGCSHLQFGCLLTVAVSGPPLLLSSVSELSVAQPLIRSWTLTPASLAPADGWGSWGRVGLRPRCCCRGALLPKQAIHSSYHPWGPALPRPGPSSAPLLLTSAMSWPFQAWQSGLGFLGCCLWLPIIQRGFLLPQTLATMRVPWLGPRF